MKNARRRRGRTWFTLQQWSARVGVGRSRFSDRPNRERRGPTLAHPMLLTEASHGLGVGTHVGGLRPRGATGISRRWPDDRSSIRRDEHVFLGLRSTWGDGVTTIRTRGRLPSWLGPGSEDPRPGSVKIKCRHRHQYSGHNDHGDDGSTIHGKLLWAQRP